MKGYWVTDNCWEVCRNRLRESARTRKSGQKLRSQPVLWHNASKEVPTTIQHRIPQLRLPVQQPWTQVPSTTGTTTTTTSWSWKADVTAVPTIATRVDSPPNLLCITRAVSLKSVADPLGLLSLTHVPCSNCRQLWECKEVTLLDIYVVNGICFSPVIFILLPPPQKKRKGVRFWETQNNKHSQILSTYELTSACIRFSWKHCC